MLPGGESHSISPDLVGDVSVRRDPIGSDDDTGDATAAQPARRHVVGDNGAADPCPAQLPGGEPASLEQRPRFISDYRDPPSGLVCQVDRGEGGSDPRAAKCAGVAVGVNNGAIGEKRESRFADPAAHGAVLVPDHICLGDEGRVKTVARGDGPCHLPHALEGPGKVDRGGARRLQQVTRLENVF